MLVLHYSWISTIILFIICVYFYFYKYFYKLVFESFENSGTYILLGDSILNNSNYVKENENIESKFNDNAINLAEDNANLFTIESQINKLNDLLKNSDGEPIDIDLLIETLIDKNIDEEMKILVKFALDSYEENVNLRDIVEGIINLFDWRENNC